MKPTCAIALVIAGLFLPCKPGAQPPPTNQTTRVESNAESVRSQLKQIMLAINAKTLARQGRPTASDLAADIGAIDKLLADHAGQKTDELAQAALIKAMIHGKLLSDSPKAKSIEKKLKEDFKGTAFVRRLEREEGGEAEEEEQESLETGLPFFPDFYATNINGSPISVTQLKGRTVLVYCWASWCEPCLEDLPGVIRLYKNHHDAGLEIIGISLDSDRDKFDEFLKNHPDMKWTQYYDGIGWGNKISSKYGIRFMPYSVLVNTEGDIVAKGLRGKALTEAVESACKKSMAAPR